MESNHWETELNKLKQNQYDIVIDAIFGFSFSGDSIREPFKKIISDIKQLKKDQNTPAIVSVDVPSGWHVEEGNILDSFSSDMLVSMTTPKKSAIFHEGAHYLGCRFIPQSIADKYQFKIPEEYSYSGCS